jgi:four helix bundle suffix protein
MVCISFFAKSGNISCLSSDCLVAIATLSLLNLACYFLEQQVRKLATDFTNAGGFAECLYRVRKIN